MIRVLTLSWNGLDMLKQLKPTLEDNLNKTRHDWRWHIRSNGCTDGTQEEVGSWNNVDLMKVSHNRDNFSVGVNSLYERSLSEVKTDLILLLNNDVKFKDDDSLNKMVKLMDSSEASAVGARLMYPNSNKISHVGVCMSVRHGSMPWHLRDKQELEQRDKVNRYFQAVTGACLLTKADVFERAGCLSNKFNWAFDDVSFCLSVSKTLKEKVVYCGGTEIEHGTSVSLKKNPVHNLFMAQNVKLFKDMWFGKTHSRNKH